MVAPNSNSDRRADEWWSSTTICQTHLCAWVQGDDAKSLPLSVSVLPFPPVAVMPLVTMRMASRSVKETDVNACERVHLVVDTI